MKFNIKQNKFNFKTKYAVIKEYPDLENIEITPSKEEQTFKSKDYYGYDEVKVNGVTNEIDSNIAPENIKQGVNILGVTGNVEEVNTTEISINPTEIEQIITPDEPYNGFSKVTVGAQSGINPDEYFNNSLSSLNRNGETSGGWRYIVTKLPNITIPSSATSMKYFFAGFKGETLPYVDTSNITEMNYMCQDATIRTMPVYDTSKVTNMNSIVRACMQLVEFPQLDTSKVQDFTYAFFNCNNLITIPLLDFSSAINMSNMLNGFYNLQNIGGFKDVGKAYLTTQTENYGAYTINLSYHSNITYDSLINVFNGLFDIASLGVKPQKVIIGSTNIAKLEATEEGRQAIENATNKGWSVS